ncbi:MAG: ATP-binding protein, partial [Planctomycetes bacterium]|nr:ATP-binding protein [Planctomycetota bacterium]
MHSCLGRPDIERDSDLETVGMYGIGMKRAIFKMGENCVVTSQPSGEDAFKVSITKKWMDTDGDWNLPIESVRKKSTRKKATDGTKIHITQLRTEIRKQFKPTKSNFEEELKKEVSHLFAIIIEKGFTVKINSKS